MCRGLKLQRQTSIGLCFFIVVALTVLLVSNANRFSFYSLPLNEAITLRRHRLPVSLNSTSGYNFTGSDLNETVATTTEVFQRDRYVSFGEQFRDGRGIGNQLFNLASVLYVAALTGRQPAIMDVPFLTGLEEVFQLEIPRYNRNVLCPCYTFSENQLSYDARIEKLAIEPNVTSGKSIVLNGFYQSWKYIRSIGKQLRRRLVFRKEIQAVVDRFLADAVPQNWTSAFVRVGVHVRRGDIADNEDKVRHGYTVPNETYFRRAMHHFVELYGPRVQFIVVTNDLNWCRENFGEIVAELNDRNTTSSTASTDVSLTYSVKHSAGEDLAVLASCDHVIMSVGTYGWWGSWLAGGSTVYYSVYFRKGSPLSNGFKAADLHFPDWIGME